MIQLRSAVLALSLLGVAAACSSEEAGCKTDNDCKGSRICKDGDCADPSNGSGGSGAGGSGSGGTGAFGGSGTGGFVSTGGGAGAAGCPAKCQTSAGTCCQGPGVCDIVVPCTGNPCCT